MAVRSRDARAAAEQSRAVGDRRGPGVAARAMGRSARLETRPERHHQRAARTAQDSDSLQLSAVGAGGGRLGRTNYSATSRMADATTLAPSMRIRAVGSGSASIA